MGRTIPTASMLLRMEQQAWKPFRNALDKKDRKKFDEMMVMCHQYNYSQMCSNPLHPVPIQPIMMTIVFQHYKELFRMMHGLDNKPNE
jgi:hypothetical protein